jgi:phospholipid/cholesterol/gamma-HCH transport system substrate-binding protein
VEGRDKARPSIGSCETGSTDRRSYLRMNRHDRGLELKVGIFVFVGLAAIGALVVEFGRLGEGFKTYYALTIRFTDASGLLKGSDVLLAGARIGKVAGGPRMTRDSNGVDVPLKIYDYIKIPEGSKFTVGSSGLLGDRFVNVVAPMGERKKFIQPKSYISGVRETGLDDLTREGGALVADLRGTVKKIDTAVDRLNDDALSAGNMDHLKASMQHLSEATYALAQSSTKLDGVVGKADAAMDSIKQDADSLQVVLSDARKTMQTATQVFREATEGKGVLASVLTNQQVAADLRALITNLRAHGVLFYRDTAAKTENVHEQPAPRRPAAGH